MTNVLMPDSAPMALKLNTRKPQRITITVSWSLYQALGLPQFSGQVSGFHGCECTRVHELLFVVNRAQVADR
jgi:hypothetical protein